VIAYLRERQITLTYDPVAASLVAGTGQAALRAGTGEATQTITLKVRANRSSKAGTEKEDWERKRRPPDASGSSAPG
jgi:hypothetical protein